MLLRRNVGNGFKDWATTREIRPKREEKWGLHITRTQSFHQELIRNHNPQNRFQIPQICEDQVILFLHFFGKEYLYDISQFKNTLYEVQPKHSLQKHYNATSRFHVTS